MEENLTVKIGINPNTWALDDVPELKNFTTAEQCLSEASLCGYTGMEMGGLFSRKPVELKPMLARYNLELISAWYDGRLHELGVEKDFELSIPHLTMLREMGCAFVVYADCSFESFSNPATPLSRRPRLI
jgi:inosose dehydratase